MTGRRVLIVDDDATLRQLLRLTLPAEDYRIFEAEDGQKALELVDHFEPDLVLLDWKMPNRSGEEVLAELKAFHPRLPVIVLTAGIQARHRMVADSLGADVFLTKPFSPLELLACIEQLLGTPAETGSAPSSARP
jgi:DNA-binding response OmpR family regulator